MGESKYFNFTLEEHANIKPENESGAFCCTICSCYYKYEFSLKRHFLRNHINRAYIQPNELISLGLAINGHHQRKSADVLYSCNACQLLFDQSEFLVDHIKLAHHVSIEKRDKDDTVIIRCPECKAEFDNMRSLNCHARYHKSASWTQSIYTSPNSISGNTKPRTKAMQKNGITKSSFSPPMQFSALKTEDLADRGSNVSDNETEKNERIRQLRTRNSIGTSISFKCTICHKCFQSYGNMRRHRRLTHEAQIKKKPAISVAKKIKRLSRRSQPSSGDIPKEFFEKVSSYVAYNVRNCVHGNMEHLKTSKQYHIDISSNGQEKKSPVIDKKAQLLYNIKTVSVSSILRNHSGLLKTSSSYTSHKRSSRLNGAVSDELNSDSNLSVSRNSQTTSRSSPIKDPDDPSYNCRKHMSIIRNPELYDQPGLWKFLCTICLQYFPNTFELFVHQDNIHKRVKTSYIEVGKDYDLPLQALSKGSAVGYVESTSSFMVSDPVKYTCTKCQTKFKTISELHPHVIDCGKDLLKPLAIQIPPITLPPQSNDSQYGKIKCKKREKWIRDDSSLSQKKISDIFPIRKKKKSRLEIEAEEQLKFEMMIKMAESLSPTQSVTKANATITSSTTPKMILPEEGAVHKCPFCSITFKYRKVYLRHVEMKCEMMKRMSTSNKPSPIEDEKTKNSDGTNGHASTAGKPQQTKVKSLKTGAAVLEERKTSNDIQESSTSEKQITLPSQILDDFLLSSHSNSMQAKVLAKFIHPARVCGPCFTCKKPNLARRYIHLRQRFGGFVEFVMSRHKGLSPESCICKACELRFREDYDKSKNQPTNKSSDNRQSIKRGSALIKKYSKPGTRYSVAAKIKAKTKKSHIKKVKVLQNFKVKDLAIKKRNSDVTEDKVPETQWARPKGERGKASSIGKGLTVRHKVKPTARHQGVCNALKTNTEASTGEMESHSNTTRMLLTSHFETSLEICGKLQSENVLAKIDNTLKDGVLKMDEKTITNFKSSRKSTPKKNCLYSAKDVIHVNKGDPVLSTNTRSGPETVIYAENMNEHKVPKSPETLLRNQIDLPLAGLQKKIEDGDTHLQMIMKIVGPSPPNLPSGRKSSLTEIIDAVTQKVKSDPSLARTLTDAINAAVVQETNEKKPKAKNVRVSISLPSVLDGLAVKMKDDKQHKTCITQQDIAPIKTQPVNLMAEEVKVGSLTGIQGWKTPKILPIGHQIIRSRRPNKRRLSSESEDSCGKAKRSYIMSQDSHNRMVGIIDAVASGFLGPNSSDSCDSDNSDSMLSSIDTSSIQTAAEYNFLMDSQDKLSFIRTNQNVVTRPAKNQRLTSIINKLIVNQPPSPTCSNACGSSPANSNAGGSNAESGYSSVVG